MSEHITIAGAGLAGSLLSIYLAKRGHTVTVFERRPDMRQQRLDAGRSINLALANRGLRALEAVGLADAVRDQLIPMQGRMLHEPGMEPVLQPYGKDEHEVIYSVSRPGLNALLLNEAEKHGVNVRFNQTLVELNADQGLMKLTDRESGRDYEHTASPLIATDGSGSLSRRTLGFMPGSSSSEEYLEHGYKELTIPAGKSGEFLIEKNALHVWPRSGYMLIALPNLDGSFTVTLFMPREGKTSFESLNSEGAVNAFFSEVFPDVMDVMPQLGKEFFTNPTGRLVTVRCNPWHHKNKVLLLGDAAHAIVPFHGQGMNCAFEDCYIFDKILGEGNAESPDWRAVFALFEARRRHNANAIADLALDNYIVMRSSVRDPRFHLKKTLSFELERRFPTTFIPRYSMVMFHHVPYAAALQRGVIQERLLEQLIGSHDSLDHIDYKAAEKLLATELGEVPPGD
ncbi:MAG: FAD-dependent oxidoreductase [Gammaproteobacteria bacterium]